MESYAEELKHLFKEHKEQARRNAQREKRILVVQLAEKRKACVAKSKTVYQLQTSREKWRTEALSLRKEKKELQITQEVHSKTVGYVGLKQTNNLKTGLWSPASHLLLVKTLVKGKVAANNAPSLLTLAHQFWHGGAAPPCKPPSAPTINTYKLVLDEVCTKKELEQTKNVDIGCVYFDEATHHKRGAAVGVVLTFTPSFPVDPNTKLAMGDHSKLEIPTTNLVLGSVFRGSTFEAQNRHKRPAQLEKT
eukprot:TRINITY_DN67870_c2_g1_i4.p2 TRINITY_DN67870_c2_g1~~TRINITY_DN67870_c2_g1_i4.p2  ORF type:complete len:249 (-),score=17.01 TRINITY_DN67870_c2_g1_i4:873-1619(-)